MEWNHIFEAPNRSPIYHLPDPQTKREYTILCMLTYNWWEECGLCSMNVLSCYAVWCLNIAPTAHETLKETWKRPHRFQASHSISCNSGALQVECSSSGDQAEPCREARQGTAGTGPWNHGTALPFYPATPTYKAHYPPSLHTHTHHCNHQ